MTAVSVGIFLISAAALGLELVLVRALSIGHWHHFSYLVISVALLGFAGGGTLVSIFLRWFNKHWIPGLYCFAIGLSISVPLVFIVSQKIPLDEMQLIWDSHQIIYMFIYYLLFFVPFLSAGSFIALAFSVFGDKAHHLYFWNMFGSGSGVAAVLVLMYWHSPQQILFVISIFGLIAASILAFSMSRVLTTITVGLLLVFAFCLGIGDRCQLSINICENKALVYYQALPDAKKLAVRYSPLSRLDCISAMGIRYFPDLSFGYRGTLPQQQLIISDADGISSVNSSKQQEEAACYGYMTSSAGYHLLNKPSVCIIGAGGGSGVVQALSLDSSKVTAVEMNTQVVDLIRNELNEFTSGLYKRDEVEVIVAEGRNFLQTIGKKYDIISISLLDSYSASAAGVHALNESHLYTVEAIEQALDNLSSGGLLSITRTLQIPPRDSLKMLATIAKALRRQGYENPDKHIAMIRGMTTGTIIASNKALSDSHIAGIRAFAKDKYFDIVWVPGISPEEVNLLHVLEEPMYYQAAKLVLSGEHEAFYNDYIYDIRPATDDRPYFFDFFKWRALPHMIRTIPGQWLPLSEWGYLVLFASLIQAVVISCFFILLPLWIAKPIRNIRAGKLAAVIYFLLLGLAYMFLEMAFIQKMTLLIGQPVFGIAVTLVGFLVFSGIGSLVAGKILYKSAISKIRIAVVAIVIIGVAEVILLSFGFDWLIGFSKFGRIVLGVVIAAPLAFFMGMPFPSALKKLNSQSPPLVPWGWGVNGFASVSGAVLGTLLAISFGFTILFFISLICYFLAAMISTAFIRRV